MCRQIKTLNTSKHCIRIVSYNVLAPITIHKGFSDEVKDNYTDDYTKYTPIKYLKWDYRFNKILEELNMYKPDIICLQEVQYDNYYSHMNEEFNKLGYFSVLVQNICKIKCLDKKYGVCILYKKNRFRLIETGSLNFLKLVKKHLKETNQTEFSERMIGRSFGGLWMHLYDTQLNTYFYISSIHFMSDPKYPDIKNLQGYLMLKELNKLTNNNKIPLIICGDFNSTPDSVVYNSITTGKSSNLFDTDVDNREIELSRPFIETPEIYTKYPLTSAYKKIFGVEQENSFYVANFRHTLDYTFVNDKVTVLAALKQLDKDKLKEFEQLPTKQIPSDHFIQMTDVVF
jgi:CCR4-NOT transcription complex subunit 6